MKIVGDDDKEKDKSIDNLKQMIENDKKTLDNGHMKMLHIQYYMIKNVMKLKQYLIMCAKNKVPNLINYQFCASGFDDMSTLLHRAKLDTVNKFDNMPIELAQDNVKCVVLHVN